MRRTHGRKDFYVVGEGIYDESKELRCRAPNEIEDLRKFRFSRIARMGKSVDPPLLEKVAAQMTAGQADQASRIPAGFTYLGQFVDHDLTLDKTRTKLGAEVSVDDLVQGRSPALDLDCLYGLGPEREPEFYRDGVRLRLGSTTGSDQPPGDPVTVLDLDGFDLPRAGAGMPPERRRAVIPDHRNDENLAVAQIHLAFIRIHNRMADEISAKQGGGRNFEQTQAEVVKHYQRMLLDDYLPRICDPSVVENVFQHGRVLFDAPSRDKYGSTRHSPYHSLASRIGFGSMPLEFAVAAFRFGHSMVRRDYEWNRVFSTGGPAGTPATPQLLMTFSGTSGTLTPPGFPPESFDALPTNWIPDWRRLFEFTDLSTAPRLNFAEKIDTSLTPFLATLPEGSFGGFDGGPVAQHLQQHLAFRNLVRANMVRLASAQDLHALFLDRGVPGYGCEMLSEQEILRGGPGGADLTEILKGEEKEKFCTSTPLWFYVLREAEVRNGGEHLGPVGSRLVAETFHRSMEISRHSILRDPVWRPSIAENSKVSMSSLLRFAFGETGLNALG